MANQPSIYFKFLVNEIISREKGNDVKIHFKTNCSQQPCSKCFEPVNFPTVEEFGDGLCYKCWGKEFCKVEEIEGKRFLIQKKGNIVLMVE